MKDSGIEWIGQIPEDWKIDKMNRICSVITDYVASGSFADLAENVKYLDEPDYAMLVRTMDVSNKGYSSKPVYINEHAYNYLKNSNLFGGELLLPNIGGVGEIYIVPKLYDKMSLAPNSIIIKTNYYDKYYYYFFYCEAGALSIKQISQSTAQLKFNKTQFKQIKGCVPPLLEQQKIADFLDKKCSHIDSILEKTKASIDECKQLKQSVITQAVTKGIKPNRPMKDSGIEWIGEIPQDWEVRKVKFFYDIQTGFTPDTKQERYYSDDEGIEWLTISDLNGEKYIPSKTKNHISQEYIAEYNPNIIPQGSLLYSFKLSVGQVAFTNRPIYSNEAIAAFLPKKDICLGYLFYSSCFIIKNANENIYGAKILNQDLIKNSIVPIPNLKEQQEIADYLDLKCSEIDKLITKKEQLIAELETYKKSLIYEYVTGKKEVI